MYKLYIICFFIFSITCFAKCSKKDKDMVISQDDIIRIDFESDTTQLFADQQAVIQLKAIITPAASEAFRVVSFSASEELGTFQGTVQDKKNIVTADNDGVARASIKVGNIPGTYYISAEIKGDNKVFKTKDFPVTLKPIPLSDKLSMEIDALQPPADGFTTLKITARAKYIKEKTIVLQANAGTFLQSADEPLKITVPMDDQGQAVTFFQISNTVKPHIITATAGTDVTVTQVINPVVSYPEVLLVEPSSLYIDTAGAGIKLDVLLKKNEAQRKVSIGTPVQFRAYQLIGGIEKPVGRFTGTNQAVSNADGIVPEVQFIADTGGIDTLTAITVEVAVQKSNQEILKSALHIKVK